MIIPGNFILGGNLNQATVGIQGQISSGKGSSNNAASGQRSNSKNYFHGKETSEEALTKIYMDNNIVMNQGNPNAKKVPKAYLQKVIADNRSKTSIK